MLKDEEQATDVLPSYIYLKKKTAKNGGLLGLECERFSKASGFHLHYFRVGQIMAKAEFS